ncbi:hypothetical protein [Herbiconiux liukaitaii]|uniref:hypothetical protein n=1 Tax=Herbiconiux liukaitaii TaxID=3342799 RepID=UPI0035BB9B83
MTTPFDPTARPDPDSRPDPAAPDDLDGHTLDELADYLASGRTPRDPSIEASPGCLLALEAMEHLHLLSWDALEREAAEDPGRDDAWIEGLLTAIRDEIRPGRDIPIADPDADTVLSITEAAVRGLIRGVADALPHVLVSRTEFEGELATPGAPVTVSITAAAEFGHPMDELAEALRAATSAALATHTELVVERIDITFDDVYRRRSDD